MSLTTSLYSAPVCKIDICGEEEREKIPTFENWKELWFTELPDTVARNEADQKRKDRVCSLSHLYRRCMALPSTKKKRAESQPDEYYYTQCIDEVLERLQHTRADKVRKCKEEATEISNGIRGGTSPQPLEQVLQELPALAQTEDDFWQYSPVRFEVKATRCSQNPENTKHLYVKYKQVVNIRITQVPEDVDGLYQMCKQAGISYRGENVSAVAQSIFLRSWNKPRHTFTEAEKKEICQRQQGRCAGCKEELASDAELDHITCLAKWGNDDTSNVEFKCQLCHLEKTEQERLSGNLKSNPLASTMSRDLLEEFTMAPKPPQLFVGQVKEGDLGLDVIACRTSALYSTSLPLPRFNLLDKPETYDPAKAYDFYFVDAGVVGNQQELYERLPYTGPGWYWREAWDCPWFPQDKTTHGLRASEHCPPSLLNTAIEFVMDCVDGTYHLEADKNKIYKRYILALIGLWGKRYQYSWRVAKSISEDDRLGALFKSIPTSDGKMELYTRTETLTNNTMLPIHLIALNMEHVYVKLACDAARWRGYSIKGIRVDCVYWDEGKRCINKIDINSDHPAWVDPKALQQEEAEHASSKDKREVMQFHMGDICEKLISSGNSLYDICSLKVETAKTAFTVKWHTPEIVAEPSHWRTASDPMLSVTNAEGAFCSWVRNPILTREWIKLREDNALTWMFKDASPLCKTAIDLVARHERPDVARPLGGWLDGMQNTQLLAQIAYDNNGALIQALAPGCGKTTLIETFTQLLQSKGLKDKKDYFVMSVTHVAAALADGSTIAHFRHAGRNKKNIWLVIDECSFNSAHVWTWLSKFKMMGCKFLILGNFS